jgi:DNA polymerase kappa
MTPAGSQVDCVDRDDDLALNQQVSPTRETPWLSEPITCATKYDDDQVDCSQVVDAVTHDDLPKPLAATLAARSGPAGDTTLALDTTKAGMGDIDKATIERIINEASKGSKFYVNEQRKAVARQARLERAQKKMAEFDAGRASNKLALRRHCDDVVSQARTRTVLGQYVHFDMDAFFAAVEELVNPSLKEVPFGVGGMGMLCTSNYLARKFGVRAGMPGYIAKKLCPQLVFAWSGHELYSEYSAQFKAIVAEYDPDFSSHGLDELTMDAGPFLERQRARRGEPTRPGREPRPAKGKTTPAVDAGEVVLPDSADVSCAETAEEVSWEIRARVYQKTRLTASAGIAPTPALSKILSNFGKPDGQSVLSAATVNSLQDFMSDQPIRRVAGVGRVMDELLTSLGYTTCKEFFNDRVRLCYVLTPKTFDFLLEASIGCQGSFEGFAAPKTEDADATAAEPPQATCSRKSIGAERTFGSLDSVNAFMLMAEKVFHLSLDGLTEEECCARQVGLKLKWKTFEVHQSTANLAYFTDDRSVMWTAFESLLAPHIPHFADFRLMGCRFIQLKYKHELNADGEARADTCGKRQTRLTDFLVAPRKSARRESAAFSSTNESQAILVVTDDEGTGTDGSDAAVTVVPTRRTKPESARSPQTSAARHYHGRPDVSVTVVSSSDDE